MSTIKPARWRLTVQPSPVEVNEEERPSGLIVKHDAPEDHSAVKRGVILEVGPQDSHQADDDVIAYQPGTVVYYLKAIKIADIEVVGFNDVVAYES